MSEINGILVVNKPAGWTSHDVVKKTRAMLGGVKVGHAGTLDPFATGVLVLLVGSATKHADRFSGQDKEYSAEITFGTATDTYDPTGSVTAEGDPLLVDRKTLMREIGALTGEFDQKPPMFSAVKVGGERLYRLARRGKTVERQPRRVRVEVLRFDLDGYPCVTLVLKCSKGTYVRSIAHELGVKVGCPAHLSALVRTASGPYMIGDALDFLAIARRNGDTELRAAITPIDAVRI